MTSSADEENIVKYSVMPQADKYQDEAISSGARPSADSMKENGGVTPIKYVILPPTSASV